MFAICIKKILSLRSQNKTIGPFIMTVLFYAQLILFTLFVANIGKLILSLIIKTK